MRVRLQLPAVLLLSACATHHGPAPPAASAASAQIDRAIELARNQQFAQADAAFTQIIASDPFRTFPTSEQHRALQRGGAIAMQMHDTQRGRRLIRRACEMSEAGSLDWLMRMQAAYVAGDRRDAAASLTTLAERWPNALRTLQEDQGFRSAVSAMEDLDSDADRYQVLYALRKVHFPTEPDDASSWWRDLALLQLARNEPAAAVQTLARVNDPYVAISIEADKRFDPIRSQIGPWLSVEQTARRAIETAVQRAQDNPNRLQPMVRLAGLLDDSLRFEQVLHVTEAAIDRQESQGRQAWSDYERHYPTILIFRADALYGLGRWDAALAQEESAVGLTDTADLNVNQIINLADVYATLGRPAEALATLRKLTAGSTSPFGDMQLHSVRLMAAVELHDRKMTEEALKFMRDHRDDALGTYQEALLIADRQDEGAALLISRLADPRLRSAALVSVQEYSEGLWPPLELQVVQRWRQLVERSDVQEAIQRVGAVRRYPFSQSNY